MTSYTHVQRHLLTSLFQDRSNWMHCLIGEVTLVLLLCEQPYASTLSLHDIREGMAGFRVAVLCKLMADQRQHLSST